MSNYISIHTGTKIDDAVTKVNGDNLVANKVLVTDISNKLTSSTITDTELSYLSGVSSAIQTQINNKLNTSVYTANDVLSKLLTVDGVGSGLDAEYFQGSTPLAFALSGHSHSGYEPALTKGNLSGTTSQILVSGGSNSVIGSGVSLSLAATPIVDGLEISSVTANTVPIFNPLKQIASSAVTSTELGYLSGATSSLQNQVNKIGTYKIVSATNGDYTTLSAAITAGATRIYIKAGTYNEGTNKIEIRNNNTYILGENKENTIINFTGDGELRLYANNCIISNIQSVAVNGAAFVIGDGMEASTPLSTTGCYNIIDNCKFIGTSTNFCFYVAGASYARYGDTLDAYNARNLQTDNVISNCYMESSYIGDGFAVCLQQNVKFINNICKGSRLSFYMDRESYCEYNQFIDSNGVGLYIAGVGNNNNINHNLILNAYTIGIKSKNESEHDPLYAGMGFMNNNITHNIVYGTGLAGISIEGVAANRTMYNNINNNIVKNAGDSGIYLLYTDYNNVVDNIVDTPRYDLANTRGSGIYIVIANNNKIKNNLVIDTRTVGNGCAGGIIDRENTGNIGNIIEDNQLYCINNERTIWIQGDYTIIKNNYVTGGYYGGIQLKGADHCIVENNTCKNNTNYGNDIFGEIWLTDSADYNIIKYNHSESTATNKAKIDIFDESGSSNNAFGFNSNYGCLTTHVDNIVLENGAAYQIKNSTGTAKNAVKLTTGNVLEIGDSTGIINIPSLTASKVLSLDSSKNVVSTFAIQDVGSTSSPTFYKVDAVNDVNGVWNYTITATPVGIHAGFYQGDMYGEYGIFYGTKDDLKVPLWFGQNAGEKISLTINPDGSVKFNQLTASTVPYLDSSKNLVSSSVTNTELGYLSGVTSSIQTQINNIGGSSITKGDLTSTSLSVTNGTEAVIGTGTQIELPATPIVSNFTITDLTANRALISNTDKQVISSSVTDTELGYLSGVTSGVQSQFNKTLEEVDTIANVKLKGIADNRNVFCRASNIIYTYLTNGSAYIANDYNILTTADGGNTRWIAIQDMIYNNLQTSTFSGTGFLSRTTSTLSMVGQNFTIAPTGTSFDIYIYGVKYVKTSSSVTLPLIVGMHYVYFDNTATLTSSTTPWEIPSAKVFVAGVYCNGNEYTVQEERHGANRNMDWHRWSHLTIGTRFETGIVGTFSSSATSFTAGKIHDEDIANTIGVQSGNCVLLWYRNPTNFYFAATPVAITANVVGGALKYDNSGTLTSVTNNYFVANWLYATNDITTPIYCITSQAQYSKQADAEAATIPDYANYPSNEMKLIYSVIWKNNNGTPTYISSKDYRYSAPMPGGGTNVTNASSISYIPYSTISSTNVQAAIQELTDEVNALIGSVDALIYKGTIDCSGNPNYPLADAGWTYKVSVAGKIGGASGKVVEVGDLVICFVDGSVSGDEATVGTNWNVIQGNIDGAVTSSSVSSNDNSIARMDLTSGKVIQTSLSTIDDSGSINIPTGQFFKINNSALAYTDVGAAAASHSHGNITNAGAIGSTTDLPIFTTTSGVLTTKSIADAQSLLGIGTASTPVFNGITISGLTASNLVATDASKNLISVAYGNLSGTTDQVNLDISGSNRLVGGSITLSLPQSIATTSSPQFTGLGLGGATDANTKIYATYSTTNTTNIRGINIADVSTVTTTGSYAKYGLDYDNTGSYVATTISNTSSVGWIGLNIKNNINTTNHRGTLAYQVGIAAITGINNCSSGGVVTNSYVFKASLNCKDADGTITNGYLFYGLWDYTLGTATNKYGLYITGETSNYLSGSLEVGTNLTVTGLTANTAVVTNASKVLTSATTTDTQIGYLSTLTSNVQTQLNGKAPTSHATNASTYGYGDATNAGHLRTGTGITVTTGTISVSYGTSSTTACVGNDSRLSDTRLTTNSLTFNNSGTGGASGSTFNGSAALTVSYNTLGAAALSHTHGNITNVGAIGTTSGLPVVTTTSGVLTVGSYGNLAGTTDQVNLSASGTGVLNSTSITLSLPQSIALASTPQFDSLGLGVAANSSYSLYSSHTYTNLSGIKDIYAEPTIAITTNGTYGYEGIYSNLALSYVNSGIIHSGSIYALGGAATINNANMQGTLDILIGVSGSSGLESSCTATSKITNAYAHYSRISGRGQAGSEITNSYLYYGAYSVTNTTMGNKWGLYVTGESKNYLSGNLYIGSGTISAWDTLYRAIEGYGSSIMFGNTVNALYQMSNIYYDGAYKAKNTSTGTPVIVTLYNGYFDLSYAQTNVTAGNTLTLTQGFKHDKGYTSFGDQTTSTSYKVRIDKSETDMATSTGLYVYSENTLTVNGTKNLRGISTEIKHHIPTGVINSGYSIGLEVVARANSATLFAGTLTDNYGLYLYTGAATAAAGSAITNNYGVFSYVSRATANTTITNSYMFYGTCIATTTPITNNWGLYVTGESKNYMSGHLGIGTSTIHAWNANFTALQLGGNASIASHTATSANRNLVIYQNAYYGASNPIYVSTDEASGYDQNSGIHYFYTAPSGTAGDIITWHTALTIANTGVMTSKTITGAANIFVLNTTDTSSTGHICGIQGQNNSNALWYVGYSSSANNNLYIFNQDGAGDIRFLTNNSSIPKMVISLNGVVGIGTTDIEAWHSNYKVIEFYGSAILGSSAGSNIIVNSNSYYDGATKYKDTGEASQYNQVNGTHIFRVAPSGTADASITWTNALTISNNGTISLLNASQETSQVGGINIKQGTDPTTNSIDQITLYATAGASSTLGLCTEAVVAADTDETKFSNKLPVKINGTTYYIMLTTT